MPAQSYSTTMSARPRLRGSPVALELASAALAAGAVAALAAALLWTRADFYLHDDFQTYFIPLMAEISRLVRHCELPFVTDRLWYGGAILAEHQLGVLNPVCLALSVAVGAMPDYAAAAAIYAIAHLAIFAAGTYALLRVLRCERSAALLGALIAPTSEWIIYWGASNWIPFLTSLAWVPWAWAGLAAGWRNPKWAPAGGLGVAMVLLAGCPFTDFALTISIAATGALVIAKGQARPASTFAATLAVCLGGLLAAPAILPTIPYLVSADRPVASPMLRANLEALIGVGTPFMITRWTMFGGVNDVLKVPMLAVAWFVLPALANAPWRRLWARPEAQALALCAVLFAALSMTTSVWQFRWMFRMLPYYQLAIAALAALAVSETMAADASWRPAPTLLVIAAPLWIAAWQDQALTRLYGALAALIASVALLALRLQPRRRTPFALALAGGHAGLFLIVAAAYGAIGHRYPGDWQAPTHRIDTADPALTRYTVFERPSEQSPPEFWTIYRPGNTSLEAPGITVNGYSPFHFTPWRDAFCWDQLGASGCPDIVERLSAPIAPYGRSALDLARVDEVRIQASGQARGFGALHPDWAAAPQPDGGTAYRRRAPFGLPAPISLAPADAALRVTANSPSRLAISLRTASGGALVLARAWYPGWRAELDGRPLRMSAIKGIFVAVELPPGASGRLVVSYRPAGLTLGLAAAALALVVFSISVGPIGKFKVRMGQ